MKNLISLLKKTIFFLALLLLSLRVEGQAHQWACYEGDDIGNGNNYNYRTDCPIACQNHGGWNGMGASYPSSRCNEKLLCWCLCDEGQAFINGQCTCPIQGQIIENGKCMCPGGQIIQNGKCTCPGGQNLIDGQCTCPDGQTVVDGKCQCTDNRSLCKCPPGSTQCSVSQCINEDMTCHSDGSITCEEASGVQPALCGPVGNLQCYNPATRICVNNTVQACPYGEFGSTIYNNQCIKWGCGNDGDCAGDPRGPSCCYTNTTGAQCSPVDSPCSPLPSTLGAQTPFKDRPLARPGASEKRPAVREEYQRPAVPGQNIREESRPALPPQEEYKRPTMPEQYKRFVPQEREARPPVSPQLLEEQRNREEMLMRERR